MTHKNFQTLKKSNTTGQLCKYKNKTHISLNIPLVFLGKYTANTYIYKVFPAISFPQLFCHVNLYLFTCTQVGQLTKLILNFQMMYLSWNVRQKFLRVRLSNRHYENLAGFCQKQRRFLLVLQSLLSESSQVFTEKSVQTQLSVKTIQR